MAKWKLFKQIAQSEKCAANTKWASFIVNSGRRKFYLGFSIEENRFAQSPEMIRLRKAVTFSDADAIKDAIRRSA